ncbi:hypothetical protein BO71DRAFT_359963 [Aspergillus ellipticus CBS 707.79]|uniref:Uncharacterized protein n=1 Tax=Aspergillus ellipticus CBS 707.79 TaxID=1448320 RepID=A0A319EJS7_9EURO|nr:hypothetical protein BO71DRAFT_359963 [Aspergillus ellipticus CBS 707.79]
MDVHLIQLYGPGMSFYRTQLQSAAKNTTSGASLSALSGLLNGFQRYSSALQSLHTTNQHLESKLDVLRSNASRLNSDLSTLQLHVKAFKKDLLATWQADMLTRLVVVLYERQNWKLPGGVAVGDHVQLDRERLSGMFATAAGRVRKTTLKRKLGLSVKYYSALQRYKEIVHLRSTDPLQTERAFARWLVSEKENHWGMYRFWGALFPLCYCRSVEESAEMP